ncbi:MAG: T9SS type A sorting domain-containing protein [Cytophagaceae bacterium]|jgi:hypothetical protein|nr:T9SS type A sorting domain-containing protein [Cytophagaceae bacterium]
MRFLVLFSLIHFITPWAWSQVDIVPWQQAPSSYALFGPTLIQDDTLRLPLFEDFSGDYSTLCDIREVMIGADEGYEIEYCQFHGLKNGDSVRVLNSKGNPLVGFNTAAFEGIRYIQVINKYTIRLFLDAALTQVATTQTIPVNMCTLRKLPYSGTVSYPDTLRFVYNSGGVFVNETMSNFPVSIGVATFDGLNELGVPYSNQTFLNGYADNLTSLPINLETIQPSDSLYFSFYWQSFSFGESPEATDSLIVEFKDNTNKWNRVVRISGAIATADSFYLAAVAIKDIRYLHKGFQFRFRNYGRLSGRFDIWNVDYIVLDTGRTLTTLATRDVSIVQHSRSFLKAGTAMPHLHFRALNSTQQANLVQDNYSFTVRNLQTLIPRRNELKIRTNTNVFIDTITSIAGDIDASRYTIPLITTKKLADTLLANISPTLPFVVKMDYFLGNGDGAFVSPFGRIDYTCNNFSVAETYFTDYYAYDDGTAEMSFRSNENGIRLGNEFTIMATDTLSHVDIAFNRNNGPDLTGIRLFITIWNAANMEVYSELLPIQYSSTLNGFTRYKLSAIVRLTPGVYTIGYRQNTNEAVHIGYDRNNNFSNKIKINSNGTWFYYSPPGDLTGALMIRPIFIKNTQLVTNTPQPSKEMRSMVYPNPIYSGGRLYISGAVNEARIVGLDGREILFVPIIDGFIEIPTFLDGMYLIQLIGESQLETHKLLILH